MRYYSTTAAEMTLMTAVGAGDTTLVVDTTAGLPVTYPYTLIVDYGEGVEEVVDVTNASGVNLTVTRGRDSTSAQSHSLGAKIRHGVTARDFRESRQHEDAESGVHGVTGDVVGTAGAQTLEGKTFQPSTDTKAVTFKAKSGNANPHTEVQDSSGAVGARWYEYALEFIWGSTVYLRHRFGGGPALFKAISEYRVGGDIHAIVGSVISGATGRFLRLMDGVTELFSVDPAGVVRSTGAVVTGNSSATGSVSAGTSLSGATLAVSGNGTVGGTLAVTGALSGATITSITGAATTLAGRVTAVETNLGSQTTFAATSAARDGKRLHWQPMAVGTGDASGYRTITHGAGFTPTAIGGGLDGPFRWGIDNITSTTFRLQIVQTDGSGYPSYTGTFYGICGE